MANPARAYAAKSRRKNHSEHINWLLAVVKMLRAELDVTRSEVKRLRERVERSDGE